MKRNERGFVEVVLIYKVTKAILLSTLISSVDYFLKASFIAPKLGVD